jgi:hypothetical protein
MNTVPSPNIADILTTGGAGRHELKYAVPESVAIEVIQWTSAFLQRDRGIPGAQRITSLYLDTPSLAFYHWHEERRKERFKLRVRTYGDGGKAAWLEIKRKTAGVVRKEREEVPLAILDSLLRSTESSNRTCNAFLAERVKRQAAPRMLLRCSRDAFREKTAAGEIAVTVDRDIVCQPTSRYDMTATENWLPVQLPAPAGTAAAIVEVKFQEQPPVWMATLMESLVSMKVSFSKYHAAVKQTMYAGQVSSRMR